MHKKSLKISKKEIEQAIQNSSKIEGLSFIKAKKNTFVIKLLKQHGHAFSIQRKKSDYFGKAKGVFGDALVYQKKVRKE